MARLKESKPGTKSDEEGPKYALVAMAGTFDVLHRGHRKLLKQAFAIGGQVMIGVTTDEFARSLHKPHKFDPYLERKKQLERLLSDGDYSPEPKSSPSSIVSVQQYVIGIFRLSW